jgi:hypothetical protein
MTAVTVMTDATGSKRHPRARAANFSHATRVLGAALQRMRNLRNALFDPYRPELYYMRGPGPKSGAGPSRPE